jgi:hypothetical protein
MPQPPLDPSSRRDFLRTAVAGTALVLGHPAVKTAWAAGESTVAAENARPGTSDWQLTYVRFDAGGRSKSIEGYCSATSVRAGETIDLFLSAERDTRASVDFYRMGWYGGLGGRHVGRLGPLPVDPQPDPEVGPNRLRECKWAKWATLTVPADWPSGVYLGKLSTEADRDESYLIFVVRDDRPADVLFQCSDNTWQAYNKWPGGFSLYDADPPRPLNGTTRVSFDRPYAKYPQVVDQPLSVGSGEFLCWEFPLAFWLEKESYDVSYVSNLDTHRDPAGLRRGKVFLSVGHDEYWSLEMFHNLKAAIDAGTNVGFLSGNSVCFWAPLVASTDGRPDRVFHRGGRYGGVSEAERPNFGPFDADSGTPALPNEKTLIGARTIDPFNGSGDWIVTKADHWLFEGTGLKNGDGIPGLVGWEFHGDPADIAGLEVVAAGTTINGGGREAHWTSTVYPGPNGNLVFNTSTIYWGIGHATPPGFVPPYAHYGRPHGADERVQKITRNFLARCGVTARA